jgi:ABC-type transporter Mla MlaB component
MFLVSKAEEPSRTIITVDGQLAGDSIAVVETCCDLAISAGKAVQLFLRDVSMVDQAGRALLCRLAARGVRLLASGVYTSYLVRALDPSGTGPLNPGASLR